MPIVRRLLLVELAQNARHIRSNTSFSTFLNKRQLAFCADTSAG
jgi:hypothetical protein